MPVAALLLIIAGQSVASPASTALRSTARAALPASAFPAGLSVVDEGGTVVGKVVSVEQGLVTIKTQHALIRIPSSAFIIRDSPVLIGIGAAQIDTRAQAGLPIESR